MTLAQHFGPPQVGVNDQNDRLRFFWEIGTAIPSGTPILAWFLLTVKRWFNHISLAKNPWLFLVKSLPIPGAPGALRPQPLAVALQRPPRPVGWKYGTVQLFFGSSGRQHILSNINSTINEDLNAYSWIIWISYMETSWFKQLVWPKKPWV